MAIVLAIEPDRRQAAHLSAIVRHQVGAELLIADTTEGALDAIGNRVPDLVLVPALLSPTDDAALAAALRVIAAAAHVRTLTIPVLSSGVKRERKMGMLAKWRKGRDESPEPDGCDPAVFAEQISAYLQEAAAARAQLDEDMLFGDHAAVSVAAVEPAAAEAEWDEPVSEWQPQSIAASQPEPAAAWRPEPIAAWRPEPIAAWRPEPVQPWSAAPIVEDTVGRVEAAVEEEKNEIDLEDRSIDLSDELGGMSEDEGRVDAELFDGERVGVYTISADEEVAEFETFDLLPAVLEPDVLAPAAMKAAAKDVAAAQITAARTAARRIDVEPEALFLEPAEPPRADIEPWVPMYLTPGRMWPAMEGMPAEMPVARTEQPDWIELVASLRQDLERRRTEPASTGADPIAVRPSDGAKADTHRLVKKPRVQANKPKPVQDEWGFFDPEQCGFSTLLAKLDEITDVGGS